MVGPGDNEWFNNHPALQDGARLQALKAKYVYDALLKWYTKGCQETPEEPKDKDSKE